MSHRLAVIDAFTESPFGGNPAGVLLLDQWPSDRWLQQFADEMKHSETAFLVQLGDNHFHLRWFTPAVEMKLCGHATLASGHFLLEAGLVDSGKPIRFDTLSGELRLKPEGEELFLDFPVWTPKTSSMPEAALTALGCEGAKVFQSELGEEYLIVLESPEQVRALRPDYAALAPFDIHLYIATAPGDAPFDFTSRVFAPALGIDEDPVTGSAHTLLAPYWADRLGKKELLALQASKRGGELRLKMNGDRVQIGGRACTIFTANLQIEPT